jgi:hypothetical protein
VTLTLRLIASLRASWTLASRLFAAALSRLPSAASRNIGTPIANSTAAMETATRSSIIVKPRPLAGRLCTAGTLRARMTGMAIFP